MFLAGTTFTELDQAASFWFALTDTWRGAAPPRPRPHTCSRQLCELPPVTAPASTGPADLPSLLARTRKAVILAAPRRDQPTPTRSPPTRRANPLLRRARGAVRPATCSAKRRTEQSWS